MSNTRILHYRDSISKKIEQEFPFTPGKTIAYYVALTGIKGEVDVYFNNLQISSKRHDFEVYKNDFLTIAPKITGPAAPILIMMAISVAVSVGTALIMNLLFPVETPSEENELPLFKITDGRNAIRKGSPLPLIVGTHKIAPDLSSKHFTEIYDDDSYFNGIYNFGINEHLEVSQLKIGQTSFGAYEDLEYELGYDGAQILLFPGNVESTAGVLLTTASSSHTITSELNTTRLVADLEFLTTEYNSKGKLKGGDLDFKVEYSPTAAGTWTDMTGIAGGPSHNWHGKGSVPRPKSYKVDVTKGQYDVRVTLVSAQNDSKHSENLRFVQLRSYEPDTGDYEGQNRMALRAKSSSVLQGTLNQITGLAEASCEVWTGSAWEVQKTSNPAWWYRHILLGVKDVAGTLIYGGGLDVSEIDEAEIKLWGAFCAANSLECNYVFGNKTPASDALALIAKCGRGLPIRKAGKASVTWDRAGRPVVALFNKSNIVEGSVGVSWGAKSQTDRIVMKFINENKDYSEDIIEKNLPGVTSPITIQEITLPGVTNVTQAGKALALESKYQSSGSRNLSFETAVEGSLRSVGEVIAVNHPLLAAKEGGRCVSVDGTGLILTLDRDVTVTGTESIRIRNASGAVTTHSISTSGTTSVITLTTSIADVSESVWNIDYSDVFKIVKTEFTDNTATKVRLHCINEDSSYYTAENDSYDYDNKSALNVFQPGSGTISFQEEPIFGNTGRTDQSRVVARWYGAEDSEYNVRYRFTSNLAHAGSLYSLDTRSRAIELVGDVGDTLELFITPHKFPHLAFTDTHVLTGVNSLSVDSEPSNITGLKVQSTASTTVFNTRDLAVEWDTPTDNDVIVKYQVSVYDETSASTLLRTVTTTDTSYVYTWDQNFEDTSGDPTRDIKVAVVGVSFEDTISLTPATITVANAQPAALTSISDAGFNFISIDVTSLPEADTKGYFVWMSESTGFTASGMVPGTGNCVYKGINPSMIVSNLPDSTTQYYLAAAYDDFKEPTAPSDLNLSTQATEATVAPLSFNPKTFVTNGLTLTPNSPSANKVAWPACSIIVTQGGTPTTHPISASNATWSAGDLYLYYKEGNATLSSTTTLATAVASDQHIIAIYKGGKKISQTDGGDPLIDGANVIAGTIGASQVVTSGLITASAQINSAVINNAHISAVDAGKINTGTLNAGRIATNSLNANKIVSGTVTATQMAANSITAANAALATASVETLKVAGNAITANASTQLSSEYAIWSGNWGDSFGSWSNVMSVVVNAGVSGAVVDAFLLLASPWVMRVAMYGGSNSGYIQAEVRLVRSTGSPSTTVPADYGYVASTASPPIISRTSYLSVRNGYGSYYLPIPAIQMAPANTAAGNVTYQLQMRSRKLPGGGNIGATMYAPAGTNLYMGGTKR